MNATKLDFKVLVGAGVGLLALAGGFLWSEAQVPKEALVAVGAVAAAVLAMARWPRKRPLAGPIALILVTAIGGSWYALTKPLLMLPSLGVCLVASAATVYRMHGEAWDAKDRLHLLLLWHGLTFAGLVTSAVFYFQFLSLGIAQDAIGRRIVLTLTWLVVGIAFVFAARVRGQPVIRDAGFGFIGVAVAKAVFYDTIELSGALRIGGLAAAGLLLLLGAWVTARLSKPTGSGASPRSAS